MGSWRINLSRIFGAPQDGGALLVPGIVRSTWYGSSLACR